MNSRTRGPDWSWCWSSRRTSCSGWPRTACCACWVESAGWPSQGAPQECCPPRERSELQARSQLPPPWSCPSEQGSQDRQSCLLRASFRCQFSPGREIRSRAEVNREASLFAPDNLCQRSPYIRQELQGWPGKKNVKVKLPPRLTSPAAEKNEGKSPARPERGQPGGNGSRERAQAIGKALEEKFSAYLKN